MKRCVESRVSAADKLIDRIVGARPAAVPAAVARGEVIGLEDLLGGLQPEAERAPVGGEGAAAGIGVERIFGVDQIAPFGRAEPRAIALGFLVAGEIEDDVAASA